MRTQSTSVLLPGLILASLFTACSPHPRIVVGCKNFTEQIILGEIIAQQIENRTHLPVERRFYLGGTYIAHQSILAGRIDIYPEYTGTALLAILHPSHIGEAERLAANKDSVYAYVQHQFNTRYDLEWLDPIGFNNAYALMMRRTEAQRLGIHSISQLADYLKKDKL